MVELLHRIKVFVYRYDGGRPDYLLLRSAQGIEGCWGPVQGNVAVGESLELAIHREVQDDVGLGRPLDVVDLSMPQRWVVGDEQVIEWSYGFRALPGERAIQLDRRWSDFQWAEFGQAFPSLELEHDRAAIMRLHTLLQAA